MVSNRNLLFQGFIFRCHVSCSPKLLWFCCSFASGKGRASLESRHRSVLSLPREVSLRSLRLLQMKPRNKTTRVLVRCRQPREKPSECYIYRHVPYFTIRNNQRRSVLFTAYIGWSWTFRMGVRHQNTWSINDNSSWNQLISPPVGTYNLLI